MLTASCLIDAGHGLALVADDAGSVTLVLNTSSGTIELSSDVGTLSAAGMQQVAAVLDGGPPLVRWVVDGVSRSAELFF